MDNNKWIISEGKITSKGILFKGLYYSCNIALKEQWYYSVLIQGTKEIAIEFSFSDLSFIRLIDFKGETCRLIKFEKFTGERLEQYYSLISIYKESKRKIDQILYKVLRGNMARNEFNGK